MWHAINFQTFLNAAALQCFSVWHVTTSLSDEPKYPFIDPTHHVPSVLISNYINYNKWMLKVINVNVLFTLVKLAFIPLPFPPTHKLVNMSFNIIKM